MKRENKGKLRKSKDTKQYTEPRPPNSTHHEQLNWNDQKKKKRKQIHTRSPHRSKHLNTMTRATSPKRGKSKPNDNELRKLIRARTFTAREKDKHSTRAKSTSRQHNSSYELSLALSSRLQCGTVLRKARSKQVQQLNRAGLTGYLPGM